MNILPPEFNIPQFKYKILTDNCIYLLFESYSKESLKDKVNKYNNGLDEGVRAIN